MINPSMIHLDKDGVAARESYQVQYHEWNIVLKSSLKSIASLASKNENMNDDGGKKSSHHHE